MERLENKYYNCELIDYLKGCSLEQLENLVRTIKSNKLNKTGIKILSDVLFALENYDLISKEQEKIIIE